MSIINCYQCYQLVLLMYMNIKYYILLVFIDIYVYVDRRQKKKQINTNFIIKSFYLFKNHNQFIYSIKKNHGKKTLLFSS